MTVYLFLTFFLMILPGKREAHAFPGSQNAKCITCHGDLAKNTVVHPNLETSCDICHAPNGKEHPKKNVKGFTLTEKLPDLCFNCHSDIQEHFGKYPVIHGPMRDSVSCMNCHNPHSSPQGRLLKIEKNDLCLSCHSKTIVTDSFRLSNIGQTLSRARSIHAPIVSDGCITCHNPHFAEKRLLLAGNYPAEQYVKGSADAYELCFICHDAELIGAKTTEKITNFRNGKNNLHFIHSGGEKGRACTMCHNVHSAVNDRLISDKLKFGNWEMKIKFELTEKGGSCLTACHIEKSYDRTIPKAVALPVQPKKKK